MVPPACFFWMDFAGLFLNSFFWLAAGLFLTPSFWMFAGLALWLFTLNGRAITQESQRLQVIKEELKTPRLWAQSSEYNSNSKSGSLRL
jgi:hypothetical protein